MDRKIVKSGKEIKKRGLFVGIFLSIFALGTILIFLIPTSIKITSNLSTRTEDGVNISFNVIEPNNGVEKKKAIIIAHGSAVNKEMMKSYSIELAAAGFMAVPYDMRGHGLSSGELNIESLVNDTKAIKSYLMSNRNDVDPDNIGFIGYSLGGEPGYQIVKEDNDFKCLIGIGAHVPEDIVKANSSRILNILMIRGQFCEATTLGELKEGMGIRLGLSPAKIDVNKLYGSFKEGNASKIYNDDNSDHLTSAWDQDMIREARDWIINTFPDVRAVDENFYVNSRAIFVFIQLIGGMGLFFLIVETFSLKMIRSKEENVLKKDFQNESTTKLFTKVIIFSLALGLPGIILMIPLVFFLPLTIAGIMIAVLFGQAFALIVLFWRISKKTTHSLSDIFKKSVKDQNTDLARKVLLGIILAVIQYLILYLSIGLNYMGIALSIYRIPWIPFYFIVSLLIFIVYGILFHIILPKPSGNGFKALWNRVAINFEIMFIYIATYFLVLCVIINDYYFVMFLFLAIPILFLLAFNSAFLYEKTGNIITGAIVNAFIITILLGTLSPYMNIIEIVIIFLGNRDLIAITPIFYIF